ncbi:MAG: hypothetical protein CMF50_06210 [Legionellales bacterium]|nr:hypothetical protein [Legionellales bacterium]|tara:strand:- start:680 stop:1120 length:441 start_codon:yes stop_codon:yes gene_type:complete
MLSETTQLSFKKGSRSSIADIQAVMDASDWDKKRINKFMSDYKCFLSAESDVPEAVEQAHQELDSSSRIARAMSNFINMLNSDDEAKQKQFWQLAGQAMKLCKLAGNSSKLSQQPGHFSQPDRGAFRNEELDSGAPTNESVPCLIL